MVNPISFSSILQIWLVEVRISRNISESPLEFKITRVDYRYVKGTGWPSGFSDLFYKKDNGCDFRLTALYIKLLLGRGLLFKERKKSQPPPPTPLVRTQGANHYLKKE